MTGNDVKTYQIFEDGGSFYALLGKTFSMWGEEQTYLLESIAYSSPPNDDYDQLSTEHKVFKLTLRRLRNGVKVAAGERKEAGDA